jgi:hypothetical protein
MEGEVKIESSPRKPGSNKAKPSVDLSTKTASVPAIDGAHSLQAIKKRAAPTNESHDENGSSVDGNNNAVVCFSSDKSSVDDNSDGRFSSANKSSKRSVDGHKDGRFSSANKSSVGVCFSNADGSSIDRDGGVCFSSTNKSSDE